MLAGIHRLKVLFIANNDSQLLRYGPCITNLPAPYY
jgi:hypothetical protein